jgi:hypothetical protein
MNAQAKVPDVTPLAIEIEITIDSNNKPAVNVEHTTVVKAGFIMWTCKPKKAGRITLSFDPFHSVFVEGTTVDCKQTLQFGPYKVQITPPSPSSALHKHNEYPYHIGWTEAGCTEEKFLDPVIIVDPTSSME